MFNGVKKLHGRNFHVYRSVNEKIIHHFKKL